MTITTRANTKHITATIDTIKSTPVNVPSSIKAGSTITFAQMKKLYVRTFNDQETLKGIKASTTDDRTNRYRVLKAYKKLDDHLNSADLGICQRNYGASFEVVDIDNKIKFSLKKAKNALKRYSNRIN